MADTTDLKTTILQLVPAASPINSRALAVQLATDHEAIIGAIKSLQTVEGLLLSTDVAEVAFELTPEGRDCAQQGSPEFRVYGAVPLGREVAVAELVKISEPGYKQCMSNQWFTLAKSSSGPVVTRAVAVGTDETQEQLRLVAAGTLCDDKDKNLATLMKRKLVERRVLKSVAIERGPQFSTSVQKLDTELTKEMLADGSWRTRKFRPVNLRARGTAIQPGHLHPLLKVRAEFREIFLEMGFEEMPTNNFVENSFWNFDALFQPQQHPARDMHDTFFLTEPRTSEQLPLDYVERVRTMHEKGGHGSQGYGYEWSLDEAKKNILRTHTTAVSARMLYKLAQQKPFKPVKYFSIDRVFRNETIDATHLAEFHQIEGLIAGYNLTLGNLIGVLSEFFQRLGIGGLEFKPAFNPYTEPSMEIFAYHPILKKVVEVGNSGVFRPEMLLPMGFPPDVTVIAWGLGLERPTMIKYGYSRIADLYGPKVSLELIKTNPICRLDKV